MKKFLWLAVFVLVCGWSAYQPYDRTVWWLEAAPALIALLILVATMRGFPLTTLSYVLILIHCVILFVGAHYTYAQVPLFDWLREPLGWERNHYDKLGHFFQGFVPAIVSREVLVRCQVIAVRGWIPVIVVALCLAFSALYELIEWWVALLMGESAQAFLGMQGDVWDTQADMLFAVIGAISALFFLSWIHDMQLRRLMDRSWEDMWTGH